MRSRPTYISIYSTTFLLKLFEDASCCEIVETRSQVALELVNFGSSRPSARVRRVQSDGFVAIGKSGVDLPEPLVSERAVLIDFCQFCMVEEEEEEGEEEEKEEEEEEKGKEEEEEKEKEKGSRG